MGARIVQIEGDFDIALALLRQLTDKYPVYLVNSVNPFRIEGQKTIVIEMLEQLGWETPDVIVLPGGNLGNTAAFGKALADLHTARLIDRLPNYIGMKDASFHSEKFMEISRTALKLRPDFKIIMGVEHLLPSYALGACGSFSSSGAIAPNLCNKFFNSLVDNDWDTARDCQYRISRLWGLFKEQYPSSLKGAMVMMGREVGPTRAPLPTATEERKTFLRKQLEALNILQTEPHGW
jgi:hypothetical protein